MCVWVWVCVWVRGEGKRAGWSLSLEYISALYHVQFTHTRSTLMRSILTYEIKSQLKDQISTLHKNKTVRSTPSNNVLTPVLLSIIPLAYTNAQDSDL